MVDNRWVGCVFVLVMVLLAVQITTGPEFWVGHGGCIEVAAKVTELTPSSSSALRLRA